MKIQTLDIIFVHIRLTKVERVGECVLEEASTSLLGGLQISTALGNQFGIIY